MPTPAVINDEIVYRQVGPGGNPIYVDPNRDRPLHQSVFLPTRKDSDGLSVLRSRYRTVVWSAYRIEQPTIRFRLALVRIDALNQIAVGAGIEGLNYLPTPDRLDNIRGEPWAHCVITEINRTNYCSDKDAKRQIKEWALGAANLVAHEDVIGPFEEPTETDDYRPANQQQ